MLALASCGGGAPEPQGPRAFVECRDTIICRAQAAERERQLAAAVAAEPPAARLDVERVSALALVDRRQQIVYVLDPGLVALELTTGKERWRAPDVSGDTLWRVGRFLAVSSDEKGLQPRVTFLDVEAPAQPMPCSLALGAPREAERANLHLFDRAGEPHIYWKSEWSYSGGVPPNEEAKKREVSAEACGVLKVDPRTCAASPRELADFVWDPPEGRRHQPGERGFCRFLSPLLDIPAAAASAPRAASRPSNTGPAARGVALRVTVEKDKQEGCVELFRRSLEAYDEAATALWSHPLQDQRVSQCRPP